MYEFWVISIGQRGEVTHNIEFEQWGLGTISLNGEGLDGTLEAQFNSIRLEGKHWNLSGVNLQIHHQPWKHLGKLQRDRNADGKCLITDYFGDFINSGEGRGKRWTL